MAVASSDVNINSVRTNDLDFRAGIDGIQVTVEAEVGTNVLSMGGPFRIIMTMADTSQTNLGVVDRQTITGTYPVDWTPPFTFTVPNAKTAGRAGNLLEPQACIISGAAPPFDASRAVGDLILLTQ